MHYDPMLCMNVPDKAKDAPSKGHEIVMLAENYLRSIGKNNSTGKYDKVVQGVRSLLSQGYLEGEELKKAVQQEADRLLKKYNPKDARTCDADKRFERYYVSFASSIKATKNMAPKTANTYVGKLLKGYLDDLDKEYNEMSREYISVRNKISKMGEEEMSDIFERYLKEGKK